MDEVVIVVYVLLLIDVVFDFDWVLDSVGVIIGGDVFGMFDSCE